MEEFVVKKIFLLLMLLILFLSACGKANINSDTPQVITGSEYNSDTLSEIVSGENSMSENNNSFLSSLEQKSKNENKKILSRVSRKKKSKLITENYTEEHIFKKGFLFQFYNPVKGYNPTMDMLDEYYGIKVECVRKVDNESYYCILKTKENGYVYCFFRGNSSELSLYNCCYMKESLTKSQFDNLKVGDTVENVTKIDSAFLSCYNYLILVESPLTKSIHLLKDGLLTIEYENDVIKNIDFNDDFVYSENGIEYSYKILKEDYPK